MKGLQQQEKQVQGLLARAYLSEAKGESAPFATAGQAKGAHKGEIDRLTTVLSDIQEALKTKVVPPTNAPVRTQPAPSRGMGQFAGGAPYSAGGFEQEARARGYVARKMGAGAARYGLAPGSVIYVDPQTQAVFDASLNRIK